MAILNFNSSGAPPGFSSLKSVPQNVAQMAKQVLHELYGKGFGAAKILIIDGVKYCFKLEKHWHPLDYKNGPRGDHQGITVYVESSNLDKPISEQKKSTDPNSEIGKGRLKLLQRIDDILNLD